MEKKQNFKAKNAQFDVKNVKLPQITALVVLKDFIEKKNRLVNVKAVIMTTTVQPWTAMNAPKNAQNGNFIPF